ncbi:NADPH-dependent F420 reductase [Algoriphagus namhaensis]
MKIGIIGGTSLGKALGKKFLDAGIDVVFGVRSEFDTSQPEWKVLNRFYDKLCPYESTIKQSDILLICCENDYLTDVAAALSEAELADKIVVDCTNSQFDKELKNKNTPLLKAAAKKTPFFKAFNNLGLDYPNSDTLGVIKETYYCGVESPEKLRVKRLIEIIGFKAIDAGSIENATLLEAFYHLGKQITGLNKQDSNCHFKLISV